MLKKTIFRTKISNEFILQGKPLENFVSDGVIIRFYIFGIKVYTKIVDISFYGNM